ncbi:MAG: protein kinase domain-containing protein [Acidimicrobiales bacterium]
MARQLADYEITGVVADDGVLPCFHARRPPRLGGDGPPVTIWVLGPLARTPWVAARARLEPLSSARAEYLPQWLESGTGEWAERPVVWLSASTAVTATLASEPAGMSLPARLRALAAAARGAHALHERGQLHAGICPQAVALVSASVGPTSSGLGGGGAAGGGAAGGSPLGGAVLAPPPLANGERPLAQVGYPPLGYVDPQLLRGEGGRWSDIWSLGATIRYAVTGSPPFPGIEDLPVVRALAQMLTVPAPAPAEMPVPVADLVERCLSRDPEARPATANDVAAQLEEVAARA